MASAKSSSGSGVSRDQSLGYTSVGAGSVVAKDLPDYSIAVGNPAKVIRDRRAERP